MAEAQKSTQLATYADYAGWPEDEHWELIEGVAYAMSAPERIHQLVSFEVGFQIRRFLDQRCAIYAAPFDVRLPEKDEVDDDVITVVQPDISIICDRDKLDRKGCRGAPDWVIEILSPSTALRDMDAKRWLYERHGVKEYWIIHPTDRWLMVYTLDDQGQYGHPQMVGLDEPTVSELFEGLVIDWGFLGI
uniref:Putative restriction endonuclease domain-containing protein n=1 Tax=uncultured Thiotrichaceae bacterium TaxID=298394 RepID=A0A6S6TA72_9GAMM|nr:MAG: Unknown protein [uncultured Thiotrichaceae bacterium]